MFLLLLIGAVILLWKSNQRLREDNIRLVNNIETLNASVKYIQTQNGKLAAQTDVLLVRTGELKELFPSEEIKAIQDSIIDQFIQNQPTLAKPKRSEVDDVPQEDLSAVEFSLPVSETVAILLSKQGKYLQAIELYEKLSLIKPEKRLYFATRISELQNLLTE